MAQFSIFDNEVENKHRRDCRLGFFRDSYILLHGLLKQEGKIQKTGFVARNE